MVYRIFVEKKKELASEARALPADAVGVPGAAVAAEDLPSALAPACERVKTISFANAWYRKANGKRAPEAL